MPNGGYCVYYPLNIFRNNRGFENWGISPDILGYSLVLAGEYLLGSPGLLSLLGSPRSLGSFDSLGSLDSLGSPG